MATRTCSVNPIVVDLTSGVPNLAELRRSNRNKDDVFQAIKTHYASFPDWTHNIEDMIAEGDKVVVNVMQIGTHKEQYQGISATGKKITNPAIHIMTIVDGQVKDWWGIEDNLGKMQQLGMELQMKE